MGNLKQSMIGGKGERERARSEREREREKEREGGRERETERCKLGVKRVVIELRHKGYG